MGLPLYDTDKSGSLNSSCWVYTEDAHNEWRMRPLVSFDNTTFVTSTQRIDISLYKIS